MKSVFFQNTGTAVEPLGESRPTEPANERDTAVVIEPQIKLL